MTTTAPVPRVQPVKLPQLQFTPYAWAKLLYFRDKGDTEIGGFGITSRKHPFVVEDFYTVKQHTTSVTVEFDDASVAEFCDYMEDQGRSPAEYSRIWIHTHPGESAKPSWTDETTFESCFGKYDWAVMFILAKGGATYARLRTQLAYGPPIACLLPNAEVTYEYAFAGSDAAAWDVEFAEHIHPEFEHRGGDYGYGYGYPDGRQWGSKHTWLSAKEVTAPPVLTSSAVVADAELAASAATYLRSQRPSTIDASLCDDEMLAYVAETACGSEDLVSFVMHATPADLARFWRLLVLEYESETTLEDEEDEELADLTGTPLTATKGRQNESRSNA